MLFYGVLLHLLLLYKQLTSKVKYLRIITLLDFISLVQESYTQARHKFSNIASHLEITLLIDRTYELTQEPEGDLSSEAQANVVELTEAPNFGSEEPDFTDPTDIATGKPRCIILLFCATFYTYCLVHLSYWS